MGRVLTGMVTVRDANGRLVTFGPGDVVPVWAVKLIKNPGAWVDGSPGSEPDDDRPWQEQVDDLRAQLDVSLAESAESVAALRGGVARVNSFADELDADDDVDVGPETVTYSGWTVAQLRDEIAARNKGRKSGARIPVDGIKTELVAALEADDQL